MFGAVTVPVSTMPCIELSLQRVETDRVATAVRAGTRQGDLAIDPRVRAKRQISLGVRISPVGRLTPFPRDSNDLRVTAPLALQVDVRRVSSALMSSAVPIVVTRGPSLDDHGLTNLGVTATTLSVGACDCAERQHEKSEWKGKSHGESSVFDRCGLSRGSPMRRRKTLRSPYALGKSRKTEQNHGAKRARALFAWSSTGRTRASASRASQRPAARARYSSGLSRPRRSSARRNTNVVWTTS